MKARRLPLSQSSKRGEGSSGVHTNASFMDLYRDERRHPAFCCCRRCCSAAFGGRLVGSPIIAPPDRHPRDPSAAASKCPKRGVKYPMQGWVRQSGGASGIADNAN
eukprot:4524462-Lingulodinium_polyedra.AAC.1